MQKLCLPFLRIASLLKFHIYQHPLPEIRTPQSEFVRLVYYLELVTESMDWDCFNASVALNWPQNSDVYRLVTHYLPNCLELNMLSNLKKSNFKSKKTSLNL